MSLQTWIDEHIAGLSTIAPNDNVAQLRHSLRKWQGLRFEVLAKHNLALINRNTLVERSGRKRLYINSTNCALCLARKTVSGSVLCDGGPNSHRVPNPCPLFSLLGESCDSIGKPFFVWCDTEDPEPMIDALGRALAIELAKVG